MNLDVTDSVELDDEMNENTSTTMTPPEKATTLGKKAKAATEKTKVALGKRRELVKEAKNPKKSDRTHEENQERAFVAASRRNDRSIEARVQSALAASDIHKRRTGKAFKITEQIVANEEMYEEEEDDAQRRWYTQRSLSLAGLGNMSGQTVPGHHFCSPEIQAVEAEFAQAFPQLAGGASSHIPLPMTYGQDVTQQPAATYIPIGIYQGPHLYHHGHHRPSASPVSRSLDRTSSPAVPPPQNTMTPRRQSVVPYMGTHPYTPAASSPRSHHDSKGGIFTQPDLAPVSGGLRASIIPPPGLDGHQMPHQLATAEQALHLGPMYHESMDYVVSPPVLTPGSGDSGASQSQPSTPVHTHEAMPKTDTTDLGMSIRVKTADIQDNTQDDNLNFSPTDVEFNTLLGAMNVQHLNQASYLSPRFPLEVDDPDPESDLVPLNDLQQPSATPFDSNYQTDAARDSSRLDGNGQTGISTPGGEADWQAFIDLDTY